MKTTLIDNDLTLAVEDAIPASPVYAPEEILALAVCASPNGSRDAGDLALLHAARERGITLPTPSGKLLGGSLPGKAVQHGCSESRRQGGRLPFHGSPRQSEGAGKTVRSQLPGKRSA